MATEEVPLVHRTLLVSQDVDHVKPNILSNYDDGIERIFTMTTADASIRDLEKCIWDVSLENARMIMAAALSLLCARITEDDIEVRDLKDDHVRLRNDDDYRVTMMTTFGPVTFFSFAYRDSSSGVTTVTRTPAREQVFPLHKHCRSSEACLEWESKLGQEMPFRRAQESMSFFTHGAVSLEDTTIERHMVTVSRLVERQWLYQTPETIREVLLHRATRDLKTDKPLIYLSTDAHALRQFVDETWDARWKMANGLRLWCVDRRSGAIIHLGGEYTWGDCNHVGKIVDWLIESGHVPADGNYGDGLVATIVLPTDGMPWIEDYVVKKFSTDAVAILDAYHLVKHLTDYETLRFGKGTAAAKEFHQEALKLFFGGRRSKKSRPRKKRRKEQSEQPDVEDETTNDNESTDHVPESAENESTADDAPWSSWEVCELLPSPAEVLAGKLLEDRNVPLDEMQAHLNLIDYLENNAYRMDYMFYRSRGYQIGSGAMESLHRSGSQIRLKLPGLKSLPETSQAIFNLRMLYLCGRWDEFWNQPDFYDSLVDVFIIEPDGIKRVRS